MATAKASAAASFAWVRAVRFSDERLGMSVVFVSAFSTAGQSASGGC